MIFQKYNFIVGANGTGRSYLMRKIVEYNYNEKYISYDFNHDGVFLNTPNVEYRYYCLMRDIDNAAFLAELIEDIKDSNIKNIIFEGLNKNTNDRNTNGELLEILPDGFTYFFIIQMNNYTVDNSKTGAFIYLKKEFIYSGHINNSFILHTMKNENSELYVKYNNVLVKHDDFISKILIDNRNKLIDEILKDD